MGKFGFVDSPGGRKIHSSSRLTIGGFPMFIGFIGTVLIWLPFEELNELKLLLGVHLIIFFTGIRDDLSNPGVFQKLLGQIVAATIITFICGIHLDSLFGLFGIFEISKFWSNMISIFTIIVITNAYNLIDGIDGLAASIGIVASTFFSVWFYLTGLEMYSLICFATLGTLIAFLRFNWEPSKVFLGDTGSLFIGFLLSIMTIIFINTNYSLEVSDPLRFTSYIGIAISVLIVPLYDTIRVFIKRSLRGISPMRPDKTHIHHVLVKLCRSHARGTLIITFVNLGLVFIAMLLDQYSDVIVVPTITSITFSLVLVLEYRYKSFIKKRKLELRNKGHL